MPIPVVILLTVVASAFVFLSGACIAIWWYDHSSAKQIDDLRTQIQLASLRRELNEITGDSDEKEEQ